MSNKQCYRCRETKPTSEFHAHATNRDRLQGYCKDCKRIAVKNPVIRKQSKICTLCASLSHRVEGLNCAICGLRRADI